MCSLYDFPQFCKIVIEVTTEILTFNTHSQNSTLQLPHMALLTPLHPSLTGPSLPSLQERHNRHMQLVFTFHNFLVIHLIAVCIVCCSFSLVRSNIKLTYHAVFFHYLKSLNLRSFSCLYIHFGQTTLRTLLVPRFSSPFSLHLPGKCSTFEPHLPPIVTL